MAYANDPGGRFASDVHRRTLGNLSTPTDTYGWSEPALLERMRPDVGTEISTIEELQAVLGELETEGHAVRHEGNVWQMSQEGFDALTGPIANEPPPGAAVAGPATINAPGAAGASPLNGGDLPPGVAEDQVTQPQDPATAEQPAPPPEDAPATDPNQPQPGV